MRDSSVVMEPPPQRVIVVEKKPLVRRRVVALDIGLFILRLTVGGLMLFHCIAKLSSGGEMIKPGLIALGLPDFLAYGVYIAEVLAPILIILGIRARLAAMVIVFEMIMALIIVHQPDILTIKPGGS